MLLSKTDPEHLVFVEIHELSEGEYENRLYTIRADGTGKQQLSGFSSKVLGTPSVSPDGEQNAFTSRGENGKSEVFLMSADGSDPRQVTSMPCSGSYSPK